MGSWIYRQSKTIVLCCPLRSVCKFSSFSHENKESVFVSSIKIHDGPLSCKRVFTQRSLHSADNILDLYSSFTLKGVTATCPYMFSHETVQHTVICYYNIV